ncbi:hypothetical protein ACKKBG_A00040 [Auxenochlorella protothecoides x Auxenochlorella symbiontica]|uniref:Uncharacterized protein n=2 Tax=Auxenochlorella protothecoides TaxID=3075 RepID=A0A1D2A7S4_AUXPR|nr:hypothetical protein APUTEX25_002172 [Auxenochlorella protothecoides]|eukprot:RMZ54586.1 hypothetical protein APUTEX25_002172 [Auxenochlorella protothecoides]
MTEPQPFWHGLAAGACATMTSRVLTYPPDTIKARLQVQGAGHLPKTNPLNTFQMISQVFRTEGVRGFYRGFGGIMLTVIPANMCYFSGYELGKRITPPGLGVLSDVATAAIAQGVAGIVYCPIDIVKQRVQTAAVMEAGATHRQFGVLDAARQIWAGQGVKGFFRGYLTMNALWMPWNLIYIPAYEACKRRWYYHALEKQRTAASSGGALRAPAADAPAGDCQPGIAAETDPPLQQLLPIWAFPLCSSVCAATAAICTHPIDVVKTRLQVLSAADPSVRRGAFQIAGQLLRQEGLRGFKRGLGPRVVTMAAGSSVSWFGYELVKRRLLEWERDQ